MMKNQFFFLWLLFVTAIGYGQSVDNTFFPESTSSDSITFIQIKTDTLFDSNQIISLIILPESVYDRFDIQFGYSRSGLEKTSRIAQRYDAEAAINGGFFDMGNGGGVAYFEIDDTVIDRTLDPKLKWAKSKSLINGAIVLKDGDEMIIQPAQADQTYEKSTDEEAVLVTGPLLLLQSEKVELPPIESFVNNRHPRTCLCTNEESVVFITIDGRSAGAEGMSLTEAQQFLQNIGCADAINLDGGGSTTMWIKSRGVVNFPSDKEGERPVSNVLMIVRAENR